MKTLFGSDLVDVMNRDSKYYVSYKNPTKTTPDICETMENLIYDAERLPLDNNGHLFDTEAGRKVYIEYVKQGFAYDCATMKAIVIDKSIPLEDIKEKVELFNKKHKQKS